VERWGRRDRVVIATKVGLEWRPGGDVVPERQPRPDHDGDPRLAPAPPHGLRRHLSGALAGSARSVRETAEALHALYREGRIRAIGVSNYFTEQMEAFRQIAPIHTAQPPYNLFEREAEDAVLPYCRSHGIATLTYGALCRGLLSGRMKPDTRFDGDDLRRTDPKFRAPRYGQYLSAVAALERLARERYGKSVLALAVRWVLDTPGVSVALWGARSPAQLAPVDDAFGWSLDPETRVAIDRIVREHVSDPVGPGVHGSAGPRIDSRGDPREPRRAERVVCRAAGR
jgi:aryl-alcohol dehydrogenase-like predicted oxidoreductase